MLLIVAIENWTPDQWDRAEFRWLAPDLEVIDAREPFDPRRCFAAVWKPKPGPLARLPTQGIFNLGLASTRSAIRPLPDVPVVRIVDPDSTAMTEWVVRNVLARHRRDGPTTGRNFQARAVGADRPAGGACGHGRADGALGVRQGRGRGVWRSVSISSAGAARSNDLPGVTTYAGTAELPAFPPAPISLSLSVGDVVDTHGLPRPGAHSSGSCAGRRTSAVR